jgi:hypothetical protein
MLFPGVGNPVSNPTVWTANEVRYDIGVEQNPIAKNPPALPKDRRIFDWRKFLVERWEGGEKAQERLGWRRLNNKFLALLTDNCVLSRQLEFPGNSHSLIPPILEQLDVPSDHPGFLTYVPRHLSTNTRRGGQFTV